MLGIADTGVDMDNCQFWESANNPSFPQRGLGPLDNGRVDMSRRKVATYEAPPGQSRVDRSRAFIRLSEISRHGLHVRVYIHNDSTCAFHVSIFVSMLMIFPNPG